MMDDATTDSNWMPATWHEPTTVLWTCKPCMLCGKEATVSVDGSGLRSWLEGEHVQHAFPGMSADTRELLISGTHPACFDKIFGDDDVPRFGYGDFFHDASTGRSYMLTVVGWVLDDEVADALALKAAVDREEEWCTDGPMERGAQAHDELLIHFRAIKAPT